MSDEQRRLAIAGQIKEFLETSPLYVWLTVDQPALHIHLYPALTLELYCMNCKSSRPFKEYRSSGGGAPGSTPPPPPPKSGQLRYHVSCAGCGRVSYDFYAEYDAPRHRIRKIGQLPPWSIAIDPEVEEFLGESAEDFKKGKICESQGYGIGAYAYYRRVLESSFRLVLDRLREEAVEREDSDQVEVVTRAPEQSILRNDSNCQRQRAKIPLNQRQKPIRSPLYCAQRRVALHG